MAQFKSTVTDKGVEVLTRMIAAGHKLNLVAAAVGDGVANVSPNTLTDLVHPIAVDTQIGEKSYVEGEPSYIKIPVQVTNRGLTNAQVIREVVTYGQDEDGIVFAFTYSWLDGEDSDNILPSCSLPDEPDTIHIHDVAVVVTSQEDAFIQIQVGVGSYITRDEMIAYAATIHHTQTIDTIINTDGKTMDKVLEDMAMEIQTIKEQTDTGFTGATATHTFTADQIGQWKNYECTGYPEGVWDMATGDLYL